MKRIGRGGKGISLIEVEVELVGAKGGGKRKMRMLCEVRREFE